MSGWQRMLPEVSDGGDCGGDLQVSDAFNARWSKLIFDGKRIAVVTRSFYVAKDYDGLRYLDCKTEYLVCTDPTRPGDTELASDSSYDEVGVGDYSRAEVREAALNADAPTDDEWDRMMPGWPVAACPTVGGAR